jgi:hypothetical protein
MGKQTRVQELLGAKARREREFEKAMRASMASDEDAAATPAAEKPATSAPGAPGSPAAETKSGAAKPVKV